MITSQRPSWPGQIRDGLENGMEIEVVHSHMNFSYKAKILSCILSPESTHTSSPRLMIQKDSGFIDKLYYTDFNLMPYESGFWNGYNYIRTPRKEEN